MTHEGSGSCPAGESPRGHWTCSCWSSGVAFGAAGGPPLHRADALPSQGPGSSSASLAGPEVLLPDPRPPVLRHGVRQRGRGRALPRVALSEPRVFGGPPSPLPSGSPALAEVAGPAQASRPAALLPPVPGAGVSRGPGPLLRRGDRVGPGLPALGEERGVQRPQGGGAGSWGRGLGSERGAGPGCGEENWGGARERGGGGGAGQRRQGAGAPGGREAG